MKSMITVITVILLLMALAYFVRLAQEEGEAK
ncbi:hypothetical protein AusDCA_2919 [Desulfitobacterium sp. AusDCA]